MEKRQGKSVFAGVAIGKISFYIKDKAEVVKKEAGDQQLEIELYKDAKKQAKEQLGHLYEKALSEVGMDNARIFQAHSMILNDEEYDAFVIGAIKEQNVHAEYAVAMAGEHFAEMFASMEDDYFKERAADIKDVSERVQCILGGREVTSKTSEPAIIVAEDLTPSETIQMNKSKVLAFVTKLGSANSHTAILSKTMNIPALVGVEIKKEWDGKVAIVDGLTGDFYIEPDGKTLEKFQKKKQEEAKKRELYNELKGKENITLSGKKIELCANIGNVADLEAVVENDAGGIGLFRSEFLYLGKNDYPTEEEQFEAYKKAAETMAGKPVIVRTLDIGADKQVDYFGMEKEENPAMGYRAIRICLKEKEIFKTQLRAILRAGAFGNVSIMYPMIISVSEMKEIKELVEQVKKELLKEKIPFGNVAQGIMIETPAAAIISDLLAEEVDFFSIGTNDLTQYVLAIDRQNNKLDSFYDAHHEAILRLIKMVVDNGHKAGIKVGICGELAADVSLTETFLKMGVDELSVSPAFILPVRKVIREIL